MYFDSLKAMYARRGKLSELQSVDAVLDDGKGRLLFVEFKNGFIDRKTQFELQKKIYDSVLIFLDTVNLKLSDFRQNSEFILVYNKDKNQEDSNREDKNRRGHASDGISVASQTDLAPESRAFSALAENVARHGNQKEFVRFGLTKFKNYLFYAVHTYCQDEFEQFLISNHLMDEKPEG